MNTNPESNPTRYIWQQVGWPALTVDSAELAPALDLARLEQGRLLGQLEAIGLAQMQDISRELWVQDTLATAAIEGEMLNVDSVRSSVARRLGLSDVLTRDRDVDGLVELMEDASSNYRTPLTHDRVYRWQAALFAGSTIDGLAGIRRVAVGRYRSHLDAMQIVSGRQGMEVVHYQAPASSDVAREMSAFLSWFNTPKITTKNQQTSGTTMPSMGGLVRAAIAHLWFEAIHPFEDGNGRVGRAIADLALAQDVGGAVRVFGLSKQLLESRKEYYDALNAAQRGGLDITPWVLWFVQSFTAGCVRSQAVVRAAMQKTVFWQRANAHDLNARQRKILARLLDAGDGGFLGGMTTEKYSKINGISKPTATRDLVQLQVWDLLLVTGMGKATRYAVNVDGWNKPHPAA
jgi:Fic family protein